MRLSVVVRGQGQYELLLEPAEPTDVPPDPHEGPILKGPGGEEVPLLDLVLIGQSPDCDLILKHPDVGPHHLELLRMDDRSYEVRDLGSVTGTFVNGNRVHTALVGDGDELRLGRFPLRLYLG